MNNGDRISTLSLGMKPHERVFIGPIDGATSIQLSCIENAGTSDIAATLLITEPGGSPRAETVTHRGTIEVSGAQVTFIGQRQLSDTPEGGADYEFAFDAPRSLEINRERVFRSKGGNPDSIAQGPQGKPLGAYEGERFIIGHDDGQDTRVKLERVNNPGGRNAEAVLLINEPGRVEREVTVKLNQAVQAGPAQIAFTGARPPQLGQAQKWTGPKGNRHLTPKQPDRPWELTFDAAPEIPINRERDFMKLAAAGNLVPQEPPVKPESHRDRIKERHDTGDTQPPVAEAAPPNPPGRLGNLRKRMEDRKRQQGPESTPPRP